MQDVGFRSHRDAFKEVVVVDKGTSTTGLVVLHCTGERQTLNLKSFFAGKQAIDREQVSKFAKGSEIELRSKRYWEKGFILDSHMSRNYQRHHPLHHHHHHHHQQQYRNRPPIVVHNHDVLSGRGVNIAHHPGNERFRALVTTRADESYCTAYSASEKRAVAEEIIRHIKALDPPGRFLKRDGRGQVSRGLNGPWEELSEREAIKKTCQALRDCNRTDRQGYALGVTAPQDVLQSAQQRQRSGLTSKQQAAAAVAAANLKRGASSRSLSPSIENAAELLKKQRTTENTPPHNSTGVMIAPAPAVALHTSTAPSTGTVPTTTTTAAGTGSASAATATPTQAPYGVPPPAQDPHTSVTATAALVAANSYPTDNLMVAAAVAAAATAPAELTPPQTTYHPQPGSSLEVIQYTAQQHAAPGAPSTSIPPQHQQQPAELPHYPTAPGPQPPATSAYAPGPPVQYPAAPSFAPKFTSTAPPPYASPPAPLPQEVTPSPTGPAPAPYTAGAPSTAAPAPFPEELLAAPPPPPAVPPGSSHPPSPYANATVGNESVPTTPYGLSAATSIFNSMAAAASYETPAAPPAPTATDPLTPMDSGIPMLGAPTPAASTRDAQELLEAMSAAGSNSNPAEQRYNGGALGGYHRHHNIEVGPGSPGTALEDAAALGMTEL